MAQPYIHLVHIIQRDRNDATKVIVLATDSDGQLTHLSLPADHPAVGACRWLKEDDPVSPAKVK